MNNLRTLLADLRDIEIDYVISRSKSRTDARGYHGAGIKKATFYGWGAEKREKLNKIARQFKVENAFRAMLIIEEAAEEAKAE